MRFRRFHLARPGPLYWDFRCLVCDGPVVGHWRNWWAITEEDT